MITADSSAWIDFFNERDTAPARALDQVLDDSANEIILLDVVMMEVLRGVRFQHEWSYLRSLFSPLPVFIAGGEEVALTAAGMYRALRRQGTTVRSPIDLMVGAWCIRNDCVLIHGDRDFNGMEQLHGLQTWNIQ